MKKLLALIFAATTLYAAADIVLIDNDGEPVIGAAVFNNHGRIIGVSGNNGAFDAPPTKEFPISVRALGMNEASLAAPADTLVLTPNPLHLKEVTINPEERPILRLTCLLKESSGVMTAGDTTKINGEHMVEFYLPMHKVKRFKAVKQPLSRNSLYDFMSTVENVDTAEMLHALSMKDIVTLEYAEEEESASLRNVTIGNDTVFSKKTGRPDTVYRKNATGYFRRHDSTADAANGIVSPFIFKLFGCTMDFTELLRQASFLPSSNGKHSTADLNGYTVSMKAVGRGKVLKRIFNTKDNIDIFAFVEIIPLDREFLTIDDARQATEADYTLPFPAP